MPLRPMLRTNGIAGAIPKPIALGIAAFQGKFQIYLTFFKLQISTA